MIVVDEVPPFWVLEIVMQICALDFMDGTPAPVNLLTTTDCIAICVGALHCVCTWRKLLARERLVPGFLLYVVHGAILLDTPNFPMAVFITPPPTF